MKQSRKWQSLNERREKDHKYSERTHEGRAFAQAECLAAFVFPNDIFYNEYKCLCAWEKE